MSWMNVEPIIQSDISQKEKDKYHILMYGCGHVWMWSCMDVRVGL